MLRKIFIDRNQLAIVHYAPFVHLLQLKVLNLMHNVWRCDCELRPFIAWQMGKYLTEPPTCESPPRVGGKRWDQLKLDEFACAPNASPWSERRQFLRNQRNVTLMCVVKGDPEPQVEWKFYNYDNETTIVRAVNPKYIIRNSLHPKERLTWTHSLTIIEPHSADAGIYHCIASNPAGTVYVVFQLESGRELTDGSSTDSPLAATESQKLTSHKDLIFIAAILASATLLILLLFVILFCYRKSRGRTLATPAKSANGTGYLAVSDGEPLTLEVNSKVMRDAFIDIQPSVVLPVKDRRNNGGFGSATMDDDGFGDVKRQSPIFTSINESNRHFCNLRETSPETTQMAPLFLCSRAAPLADEEWEETKMPLRETAL
ncbi:unnamed protein product [Soboliphyme baturini]|uniref:Ig-like domain-containing protein n=1 Tax=Soboliphyme baturini TaxID=241478 RepID=A0A183J3S5_9BILA|nr:unnamed protein product [Soboliphyme baturini]